MFCDIKEQLGSQANSNLVFNSAAKTKISVVSASSGGLGGFANLYSTTSQSFPPVSFICGVVEGNAWFKLEMGRKTNRRWGTLVKAREWERQSGLLDKSSGGDQGGDMWDGKAGTGLSDMLQDILYCTEVYYVAHLSATFFVLSSLLHHWLWGNVDASKSMWSSILTHNT